MNLICRVYGNTYCYSLFVSHLEIMAFTILIFLVRADSTSRILNRISISALFLLCMIFNIVAFSRLFEFRPLLYAEKSAALLLLGYLMLLFRSVVQSKSGHLKFIVGSVISPVVIVGALIHAIFTVWWIDYSYRFFQ